MEDERWRLQKILSSTMYGLGMAIRMRINFRQYCAISNIRIDAHRQNIRMAIPSMDITILGNKYICVELSDICTILQWVFFRVWFWVTPTPDLAKDQTFYCIFRQPSPNSWVIGKEMFLSTNYINLHYKTWKKWKSLELGWIYGKWLMWEMIYNSREPDLLLLMWSHMWQMTLL